MRHGLLPITRKHWKTIWLCVKITALALLIALMTAVPTAWQPAH